MAFQLVSGAEIAGRYKLDRLIGKGGMGEVWSASQTLTRKHVALKFLVGEAAENTDTRRRLVREARAACAVEHPNVVQIHDVIELEEGLPAIVMELLKGESLEAKLKACGKLSLSETSAIVLRVVSAVGTAHSLGIVHRDIKPDNIFLSTTPEGVEIKVLDFGVAKVGTTEDGGVSGALTATGTMLGTPYYMAPEQAFGEKRVDHRADIWSLGIVLFRCLSGVLPTKADNLGQILKIIMTRSIPKLSAVAPELPPDILALVDRMLGYAAKDRPADLREVKAILTKYAGVEAEDFAAPPQSQVAADTTAAPVQVPVATSEGSSTSTSVASVAKTSRGGIYAVAGALLIGGGVVAAVVVGGRPSSTSAAATNEATAERGSAERPVESTRTDDTPNLVPSAPTPQDPKGSVTPSLSDNVKPPPSTPQPNVPPLPGTGRLPPTPSTQAQTTPTAPPSATSSFGGIVVKPGF